MSSPAQNVSPAPRKTTTRQSRSTAISFTAALSSADSSRSRALCTSGRFSVTVVTGPARSTRSLPDGDVSVLTGPPPPPPLPESLAYRDHRSQESRYASDGVLWGHGRRARDRRRGLFGP